MEKGNRNGMVKRKRLGNGKGEEKYKREEKRNADKKSILIK
jgi:hypothetical protein